MSDFKGRHFRGEIVLWAVRWYCRYPISYHDLEAMMTERGVAVDHSTIYRWVQRFAPEVEKRLRWQWRRPQSRSWRVDETYIKVRGKWAYLYRAVDKLGNTIDFYLSATRNTKAAKRFLGKALRGMKDWEQPEVLNTDKAPAYAGAIAELKAEGILDDTIVFTNDDRIEWMFDALTRQDHDLQIVVFSCCQKTSRDLGGRGLEILPATGG